MNSQAAVGLRTKWLLKTACTAVTATPQGFSSTKSTATAPLREQRSSTAIVAVPTARRDDAIVCPCKTKLLNL